MKLSLSKFLKEGIFGTKKAVLIGKKMLNASQVNVDLKHSYQDLGALVYELFQEGKLEIVDEKILDAIRQVEKGLQDLNLCEEEVKKIKGNKVS